MTQPKIGRPPNASKTNPEVIRTTEQRLTARERAEEIRRTRTGGIDVVIKNLPDFPSNPGYDRYYANADEVLQRKRLGWSHVMIDQVGGSLAEDMKRMGLGSSGYVEMPSKGFDERGVPRMMYLMEIPSEINAEIRYETSEKRALEFQQQIKDGNAGGQNLAGAINQTKISIVTGVTNANS